MIRFDGWRGCVRASAYCSLGLVAMCTGCGDDEGGYGYAPTLGDAAAADSGTDGGAPPASADAAVPDAALPDASVPGGGQPLSPGDLYAGCTLDADCASGACIELSGRFLCSESCTDTTDCPAASEGSALPYCAELAGLDACALACPGGQGCPMGTVCLDSTCLPLPATCSDGEVNEAETDIDCGGPDCPACTTGLLCNDAVDCVSAQCECPGLCVLNPAVCL